MILLDTNIWLWSLLDLDRLPESSLSQLRDPDTAVYVSVLSLWEVVIKSQIGKMTFHPELVSATLEQGFVFLDFDASSAQAVLDLPLHHRDPFDRGILAQAKSNGLNLWTSDQAFKMYAPVLSNLSVIEQGAT